MKKTRRRRKPPVITKETASKHLGLSVCVDKINYRFETYMHDTELKECLDRVKIDYNCSRLRNEHAISVGTFHFIYLQNTRNYISKVVTNPSNFESFLDYVNAFSELSVILDEKLKPSRLDIAMDFNEFDFEWLNKRLIVPRKSKQERYVLNGYDEQTRYFGKDPKTFAFYDREKLEDETKRGSRLESRIKGSSIIGADSLEELIQQFTDKSFNPFKDVRVVDYKLSSIKREEENIDDLVYQEKVKTLLKYNGFTYAKKVLNSSRNATRIFDKHLDIKWDVNVGELYHDLMRVYLGIEEDA